MTNKDFFACILVSREDLVASIDGLDEVFVNQLLSIDDEDMDKMARSIGEALMNGGDYWDTCKSLSLQYLKDGYAIYEDKEALEYLNNL